MSKTRLGLALACAAAVFLAACEGLFTGARESIHPLTQQQDGGFAPVRITLDPEMNPIAFNLKGATLDSPSEAGRWNAYRATLLSDGAAVATGQFNVNNTGTDQMPQGGAFATTMLIASVPRAGEYELRIELAQPKEITVESPQLEVRRNVQPAEPVGR